MYKCLKCGHEFETPRTINDDKGDESYDHCPKCMSEAFYCTDEIEDELTAHEIDLIIRANTGAEIILKTDPPNPLHDETL